MPKNVHLVFTTNAPARFELIVGEDGTHLYGYSGVSGDKNQEPDLVFDTDGSLAALGDFTAERQHTT